MDSPHSEVILLAVSGGVDSMVMAHHRVSMLGADRLAVAHCNFGLRGEESDGDEELVAAMSKVLGVTFHLKHFDTRAVASTAGRGIQETARTLRYDWFASLMQTHGYHHLETAHHLDDSIETMLINLMRGTGLRGLSGIGTEPSLKVERPLAHWTRKEVLVYAKKHGVKWREDRSNESNDYLRNSVRNELLPLFEHMRPGAREGLYTSVGHLSEQKNWMDEQLRQLTSSLLKPHSAGLKIDSDSLSAHASPRYLFYEVLREHGFNRDQSDDLYDSTRPGALIRSKEKEVMRLRDGWLIRDSVSTEPRQWTIDVEGHCAEGEMPIQCEVLPMSQDLMARGIESGVACFDMAGLTFPLTLRPWQHGDKMQPYGMRGSKKISDILTDAKCAADQREGALVLCDADDEIVWLVGRRRSAKAPMQSTTEKVLFSVVT